MSTEDPRDPSLGRSFRQALERTGVGALTCDATGRITLVSPTLLDLLRLNSATYRDEDLPRIFGLLHADGSPMAFAETPLERARAGEYVKNLVVGLHTAEHELLWLECNGAPIEGGGAWLLTQDVTQERRKAALQEELRARLVRTVDSDFREPLAALVDHVRVLHEHHDGTADLARSLAAIERSAGRLSELAQSVADLIEREEQLHREGRTPDGAPRRTS